MLLVRGLPGSGKSTFAKTFPMFFHIEADMWFCRHGDYNWKAEEAFAAHRWCRHTVQVILNQGKDVIVANTFTTLKEMNDYIEYAEVNGHGITVYTMKDDFGSIHNVPEETMERMRARFVSHFNVIGAYNGQ
jgi:predicted ABC-type ATPase